MRILAPALLFALAMPALAQEAEEPATPTSVVAEASADEWLAIAPEDLLVMDLAPDAAGHDRRVVIQLIPPPFSQPWVENIRTLARAHWWDGTSVNRVQDNYVTQWGDVTEEKELPEGVEAPRAEYAYASIWSRPADSDQAPDMADPVFSEMGRWVTGSSNASTRPGFVNGWPLMANTPYGLRIQDGILEGGRLWPIHCYGYVGVGRNYAPDTGTGAELYTIIGQPQRHMDRNLAVVGRIIEGMEHMSSLPRGHGDLGFYTDEETHLRVPIVSVRLASEMDDAPSFEYLDTMSESFAAYVRVRASRRDAFYTVPAGGVDVCSVQVPVRRVAE
ncbi:MAG: peptidylprolyl isomerase [Erythrobacter sp.]|nr:peptidylprolyl isomerase [Erythrobacter sp.]